MPTMYQSVKKKAPNIYKWSMSSERSTRSQNELFIMSDNGKKKSKLALFIIPNNPDHTLYVLRMDAAVLIFIKKTCLMLSVVVN
jgi:hypothetical protein